MVTFEEMIPVLKDYQQVERKHLVGTIKMVKCPDNVTRLRIIRGGISFPYKFSERDLYSIDWRVIKQ